jgi:integrase
MARKTRTRGIYKKAAKDGTVGYAVRYYVPDETSPNGWRQKQETFEKEADAIAFKVRVANKIKNNEYAPPVSETVGEMMEAWLSSIQPEVKSQTYLEYERVVQSYLKPRFGAVRATHLRTVEIATALKEWNQTLNHKYCNWIVARLSQGYDFAKQLGVKANPCDDVVRLRAPKQKEYGGLAENAGEIADHGSDDPGESKNIRAITASEVYSALELKKILAESRQGLERALLTTAVLTGARHSELLGLRWSEINLGERTVKINRSLTRLSKKHGGARLEDPKTKNGWRTLKMVPELVAELRLWKMAWAPSESGLVFLTERNQPLTRKRGNYILQSTVRRINDKEADEKKKLKVLAMNNLRHSFASTHLNCGTPLLKVSAMMGHSSPAITLAIYSKWAPSEKSDAETVMANSIFQAQEAVLEAAQA